MWSDTNRNCGAYKRQVRKTERRSAFPTNYPCWSVGVGQDARPTGRCGGYGIWSMPTTSIVTLMGVCWFIGEYLSESGYSGFKDLQDRNPEISHRTDGAKGIDQRRAPLERKVALVGRGPLVPTEVDSRTIHTRGRLIGQLSTHNLTISNTFGVFLQLNFQS